MEMCWCGCGPAKPPLAEVAEYGPADFSHPYQPGGGG